LRMSAAFTVEEENLFEKTGSALLRRLRKTGNPADLLAGVRGSHREFARAYESAPAPARAAVACRAGCGACCHVLVGAQAHEVLIAAEFMQRTFSPTELDAAIARTAEQRAAFRGKLHGEQAALQRPCALLRDGACTIYEGRPEACRAHHSPNADTCRSNLDAANPYVDVSITGLRGRMFAVMLGIDQAVAEAGYDGRAYDFGSALHEALTNSLCAVRWRQRQAAFPDDCREAAAHADEERAEITAEGYFR
jgi:uncharacterized protein